jgi:hypothetical protein
MAHLKLGDILEIPTPKGLAYAQYINRHKKYGALLRVFSSLHDRRPDDVKDAVGDVQFVCFFPLQAAVNQEIVAVAGNAPVPKDTSVFPTFRTGVVDPATGKVTVWWFWDGEKEWRVGTLTPEQRSMPIRGVWNDTILVERIVSGWRPENDPTCGGDEKG